MARSPTGALLINSQSSGSLFPTGKLFIFNSYATFKGCVNDQFLLKYRGNTICNTYTLIGEKERNIPSITLSLSPLLSHYLFLCVICDMPLIMLFLSLSFLSNCLVTVTKQCTLNFEVFLTISQSSLCVSISVLSLVGV